MTVMNNRIYVYIMTAKLKQVKDTSRTMAFGTHLGRKLIINPKSKPKSSSSHERGGRGEARLVR